MAEDMLENLLALKRAVCFDGTWQPKEAAVILIHWADQTRRENRYSGSASEMYFRTLAAILERFGEEQDGEVD